MQTTNLHEANLRKKELNVGDNKTLMSAILKTLAVELSLSAIKEGMKVANSLASARISVGEWDSSFRNINKILRSLDTEKYDKYRMPTTSKESYELMDDVTYIVYLEKKNYIKVSTYAKEKSGGLFYERTLYLEFIGAKRHVYREKFIRDSLRMSDKNHIHMQYLNAADISFDVRIHTFDNIVLKDDVKNDIIRKLSTWRNSESWYKDHQLVHKIGVLLYGKPGTGKSTVVRAISSMFDNAPVLIIDPSNMMDSIRSIIKMRKKSDGTLIVLIEDFDMFFKSREHVNNDDESDDGSEVEPESFAYETDNPRVQTADKRKKQSKSDLNQNAIFQLLDGAYSTDNTIYIATTNYKDRIDPALIRYGRFDIQEELDYFDRDMAATFVRMFDYEESILDEMDIVYPVQPAYLQSKIMEYRSNL